jgi:hypothetical protein
MSVTINELTITVPGNVVKNNDKDGNSMLRMNQDQLQSIVNDAASPMVGITATNIPSGMPVSDKVFSNSG